jgi:Ca-activated chloride channel family protein
VNALEPLRFTLLGYQLGFARPLYLALAIVALALGVVGVIAAFRRMEKVRAVVTARLAEALAPGVSQVRPALKAMLTSGGLLLVAVALAQPQCGSRSEIVKRQGIDLVVALDASKSMLARDVAPSRLERAKLELNTLLDELKGDRVGLVVFAGEAFIQCPLTSDYAAAKLFLRAVDPVQMPQGGSNIGDALELSRQVLTSAERGSKDRVVVLLSDGEDLAGEVDAAVSALREEGIRVYTVGIGSESGEPIPLFDRQGDMVGYQKDSAGNTVVTRLDRAGLSSIAERTDGEFYFQPRGVAMSEIVKEIDKLQKGELESRLAVRYDERFQLFALPGFLFVFAGMLVRPSARRAR